MTKPAHTHTQAAPPVHSFAHRHRQHSIQSTQPPSQAAGPVPNPNALLPLPRTPLLPAPRRRSPELPPTRASATRSNYFAQGQEGDDPASAASLHRRPDPDPPPRAAPGVFNARTPAPTTSSSCCSRPPNRPKDARFPDPHANTHRIPCSSRKDDATQTSPAATPVSAALPPFTSPPLSTRSCIISFSLCV
jgi:hypothetical protein